jgi:hypothetical protein
LVAIRSAMEKMSRGLSGLDVRLMGLERQFEALHEHRP